jgi:gamma-glutamyltranspeptidase/glutathione hydrolase/leukotriene-C4 hydrolase
MLIRDPNGRYEVVDFREKAPSGAHRDMFNEDAEKAKIGGLAVAVPGEPAGLFYAYRKYRRYRANGPSWRNIFEPSIELARHGFPVGKKLHEAIKAVQDQIKSHPPLASLYIRNGEPVQAGQILKRPNLADTLDKISNDPEAEQDVDQPEAGKPASFYQGPVAENLVRTVQSNGGILALSDLRQYDVRSRVPLFGSYRNHHVVTVGPPGSGSVLLYMLNILRNFRFRSIFSPLEAHRIIEAMKFGYGARMSLGDSDFVENMDEYVRKMTSIEFTKKQADKIDDKKTFKEPSHYTDMFQVMNKHGTTHLSVVDKYGMAVTVTSTVNLLFGSMVLDETTGVLLNDHMDDFSIPNKENFFKIPPSENNYIAPNKRPISSAAPVILETDGRLELVSGASGGSLITSAVLLSILNVVDFALSPEAALAAPRMHHQLIPDEVIIENTFTPKLEEELKAFGHTFKRFKGAQYRSSVQLIARDSEGLLHGVSDPRKEGSAGGF